MQFVIENPAWLPVCLLLGLSYAFLLYHKNKKEEFKPIINKLLFVFRTVVITLIVLLLFNPLIKLTTKKREKPIIIFAQDNSESIILNSKDFYYKNTYPTDVNTLLEKLEQHYEIQTLSFGEQINQNIDFKFKDKLTDMSSLFNYLRTTYYNKAVGSVILASDGLYNYGANPINDLNYFEYPIYTLALGDTQVYEDISITQIQNNAIVFLNNKFPVEVTVNGQKAKNKKTFLHIMFDDKTVHKLPIDIADDNYSKTFSFVLEADKAGKRKIRAFLEPLEDEANILNNSQTVYFDVIDSRSKVLIISNAPHPDIFALKESIEANINYEVKHVGIGELSESLAPYNLVILHNLPSVKNDCSSLLKEIESRGLPVLFVIGNQVNNIAFNKINTGLKINNVKNHLNEVRPHFNADFTLFSLNNANLSLMDKLPPLYSMFGSYTVSPTVNILFYQKIGQVVTQVPLLLFNETSQKKVAVLNAENLWRWRIMNYALTDNHDAINEIINKTVQFLALKVDKERLKIITKDIFFENEPIVFDAEIYNQNYELDNSNDLLLTIKDEKNDLFNFSFSKTSRTYTLNIGKLPVGSYMYEAQASLGKEVFKQKGSFMVEALNFESLQTKADHNLLFNIASRTGAEMFYPTQTQELYDAILAHTDIKPIIYEKVELSPLLNSMWLLLLISLLLSLEWFVRKWQGSY